MKKGFFKNPWVLLTVLLALVGALALPRLTRWFRPSPPENNNLPEIVLRSGHLFPPSAIAFDPKGRWFASAGPDRTVKLWDPFSGQLYRTLDGPKAAVSRLVASPDGQYLAAGCDDKEVLVWRVADGTQVRYFHTSRAPDIAFTANSRQIITGDSGDPQTIAFRDIATGSTVWRAVARGPVVHFAVSPDGHHLVAANEYRVHVWHKPWLSALSRFPQRTFEHRADRLQKIAISLDGSRMLILGDPNSVDLIDANTFDVLRSIHFPNAVRDVTFAPHGDFFAVASVRDGHPLHCFRSSDGRDAGILPATDQNYSALAFSSDGRLVAVAQFDGNLALLDARTGHPKLVTTRGGIGRLGAMAISSDGTRLAVASTFRADDFGKGASTENGSATAVSQSNVIASIWDLASGLPQQFLDRDSASDWITLQLAFGADNSTLLVWEGRAQGSTIQCRISEWNLRETRLIRQFDEAVLDPLALGTRSVSVTADGKLVAAPSGDGRSVGIWDTSTGRQLRTFDHLPGQVIMAALSPAGESLATATSDFKTQFWDARTGKFLSKGDDLSNLVAFEPHKSAIASAHLPFLGAGSYLTVRKSVADNDGWSFEAASSPILTMSYSNDGNSLVIGDFGGQLAIYGVESRTKLPPARVLRGHEGAVSNAAFLPHGQWLVSSGFDGSVRLWDLANASLAATIYPMARHDWVVTTPDGLFDGSPGGYRHVAWRFNRDTFDLVPVEHFAKEYYRPGLLADTLTRRNVSPPVALSGLDRRQPSIALSLVGASAEGAIGDRAVNVRLVVTQAPSDRLHPHGSGLRDVRLFRNGSLVRLWRGEQHLNWLGRATLDATIPIVGGENRLTAYAFNHDNIKSSDATLVVTGADSLRRKGTAYILAVGINQYATSDLNLQFAVPDAEQFASELRAQQVSLAAYSAVQIIPLLDKDATKANVLSALGRLATTNSGSSSAGALAALAAIRPAQPEDAVIIYFAGHGYATEGKEGKRFFLILHEFEPVEVAARVPGAVSDLELRDAVEHIDAGLFALIIDACQSGGALDSPDPRQGPMNSKGLAQLAYDKGMYILAAAQGNQAALEVNLLGHGLLTHALVGPQEGLTPAADSDKNGDVAIREWLDYATQRVPQLQEEKISVAHKQGRSLTFFKSAAPTSPRQPSPASAAGATRLSAPKTPRETVRGDVPSAGVQRPRVFYRREPEAQPPVIARFRPTQQLSSMTRH